MKKPFLFSALLIFAYSYAQGGQLYADGATNDQDGNEFEWINYGTQDWAIDNAEVVTYRDGTPIPQVTDPVEWGGLTSGAWCYYDNDPSKSKLYNWFAVMGIHDNNPNTPNKNFAPEGWHVPSESDWTTLENYLIDNGYNYDGTTTGNKIGKAMASTSGWTNYPVAGAVGDNQNNNNNRCGFNAIPVGIRHPGNPWYFVSEGNSAVFWSSSEYSFNTNSYCSRLYYYNDILSRGHNNKTHGFSVRFVRNASTTILDNCDIDNSDIVISTSGFCNNGFAPFNLLDTLFTLNGQDPSNYNISFHLSYIDAENNTNPISYYYTNTTPYSQTIFMRITNIDNTCLSISSILLQVDDVGDFMLETIPDQEICNCDTIEPVLFNSNNPNISANWTIYAGNYLYGYPSDSGTGNIDSYQLCNTTASIQALTYLVEPFNIENGCVGEPLTFNIIVLPAEDCTASITDPSLLNFSIYPNPAKDHLYIDSDNVNNIIVYNIFGKEIIKINNQNTVDVSSLSKGVYFIKVYEGINSSTKKFIKN